MLDVDKINGSGSLLKELTRIFNTIDIGIILIDSTGKIIYSNRQADSIILNLKKGYKNNFYYEIINIDKVLTQIKNSIDNKSRTIQEIKIKNKFFKIEVIPIKENNNYLLTLQDITEIKRFQNIKRDFVTNVSHELKTPLTAIKGYAETITGLDPENQEYLNIIKRNTNRLINTVNDLLLLSELEDDKSKKAITNIDLCLLARNILPLFAEKLESKPIKLSLICQKNKIIVKADPFHIEQILINLIDNAIKYTEKGNIKILIEEDKYYVKMKIIDTGIGIPFSHLDRIFERFYTVDKSHSRKLGGTGLGLSIVKHITNLYNGEILVDSSPKKGSIFTVVLPK